MGCVLWTHMGILYTRWVCQKQDKPKTHLHVYWKHTYMCIIFGNNCFEFSLGEDTQSNTNINSNCSFSANTYIQWMSHMHRQMNNKQVNTASSVSIWNTHLSHCPYIRCVNMTDTNHLADSRVYIGTLFSLTQDVLS